MIVLSFINYYNCMASFGTHTIKTTTAQRKFQDSIRTVRLPKQGVDELKESKVR